MEGLGPTDFLQIRDRVYWWGVSGEWSITGKTLKGLAQLYAETDWQCQVFGWNGNAHTFSGNTHCFNQFGKSIWLYLHIRMSQSVTSACNGGDLGLNPGLGKSSGEENANPLLYSCLANPMDSGAWLARVYGFVRVKYHVATKPLPHALSENIISRHTDTAILEKLLWKTHTGS